MFRSMCHQTHNLFGLAALYINLISSPDIYPCTFIVFKLSKRAIIIQGTRNAVLLNEFFSQHILVSFLPNIRNTGDTIIQGHKVSIFGSWSETISPGKI